MLLDYGKGFCGLACSPFCEAILAHVRIQQWIICGIRGKTDRLACGSLQDCECRRKSCVFASRSDIPSDLQRGLPFALSMCEVCLSFCSPKVKHSPRAPQGDNGVQTSDIRTLSGHRTLKTHPANQLSPSA